MRDRDGRTLPSAAARTSRVLIGKDDAALPDDALAPFLGGLTREVFRRAFGLDAEALRNSGEDLQKTDGELGAALFSAASGLRGLSDSSAALEKEADGIFAERKSKDRTFYQAPRPVRGRARRAAGTRVPQRRAEEAARRHRGAVPRARGDAGATCRDRDGEVPPRTHQAIRAHRQAD